MDWFGFRLDRSDWFFRNWSVFQDWFSVFKGSVGLVSDLDWFFGCLDWFRFSIGSVGLVFQDLVGFSGLAFGFQRIGRIGFFQDSDFSSVLGFRDFDWFSQDSDFSSVRF
jgi:hypothetical protein